MSQGGRSNFPSAEGVGGDLAGALPNPTVATIGGLTPAGPFLIAQTGVLAAAQASVDFNPVPATFQTLIVQGIVRTDAAATFDSVLMSLNADVTAANYFGESLTAFGASTFEAEGIGAAAGRIIGTATGATAAAGLFSSFTAEMVQYRNVNVQKVVQWRCAHMRGQTTGLVMAIVGTAQWANTAAVNRLTLTPQTGANFVAGSAFTLYGMK